MDQWEVDVIIWVIMVGRLVVIASGVVMAGFGVYGVWLGGGEWDKGEGEGGEGWDMDALAGVVYGCIFVVIGVGMVWLAVVWG